jgi:hypothetical protein
MPAPLPHKLHDQVEKDGFVVVRGFLTQDEIDKYLPAAERAIELCRNGKWPHVRTKGKTGQKNFNPS